MRIGSGSTYDSVRGVAKFGKSPEGEWAVKFLAKNKETGEEYHPKPYKLLEVPEFIANLPDDVRKKSEWNVKLTSDKNKIYSISPAHGAGDYDFVGFAAKDGEPPVAKEKKTNYRGKYEDYTYHEAYAIYESVTYGPECTTVITIRTDGFIEIDGFLGLKPQSSVSVHINHLHEWLEAHGVIQQEMRYIDNPLPSVEEAILNRGVKRLEIFMKNGYPDSFRASDNQPESDDPGWNEETTSVAGVATDEDFEWD